MGEAKGWLDLDVGETMKNVIGNLSTLLKTVRAGVL